MGDKHRCTNREHKYSLLNMEIKIQDSTREVNIAWEITWVAPEAKIAAEATYGCIVKSFVFR